MSMKRAYLMQHDKMIKCTVLVPVITQCWLGSVVDFTRFFQRLETCRLGWRSSRKRFSCCCGNKGMLNQNQVTEGGVFIHLVWFNSSETFNFADCDQVMEMSRQAIALLPNST